jgi:seryl-tRNA synthetase
MLDINYIKKNFFFVIESLRFKKIKNIFFLIDNLFKIKKKIKNSKFILDNFYRKIKKLSKKFKFLNNNKFKLKIFNIKLFIKKIEKLFQIYNKDLNFILDELPNLSHYSLYLINNQSNILNKNGLILNINKKLLSHWNLCKKYNIVDFQLGNKLTKPGFPVYKEKGSQIQRALVSFFLEEAKKKGYLEVQTPVIINKISAYGTGQLPDKENQMYSVDKNLYLIPTGEIPITNLYRNIILKSDNLPVKSVGHTLCFRKEAGSWGKNVRGLNRLHQFDKVEIVQLQESKKSYKSLNLMLKYVEGLLKKLFLPYRVLKLCIGDLGFCSSFTYDIEVFSSVQNKWLEVSSISNFETYQSNRMKIKYKNSNNCINLLHTLNGSALALPRILAALLENNQAKYFIKVPKVLIPYTKFDKIF